MSYGVHQAEQSAHLHSNVVGIAESINHETGEACVFPTENDTDFPRVPLRFA